MVNPEPDTAKRIAQLLGRMGGGRGVGRLAPVAMELMGLMQGGAGGPGAKVPQANKPSGTPQDPISAIVSKVLDVLGNVGKPQSAETESPPVQYERRQGPPPVVAPPVMARPQQASASPPVQPPTQQSKGGGSLLDTIQFGLDVAGAVEPTPVADLTNAGISLYRMSQAKTPEEKAGHLKNAGISVISAVVPYVGDVAKLGKYTKAADAAQTAARTPVRPTRPTNSPVTPSTATPRVPPGGTAPPRPPGGAGAQIPPLTSPQTMPPQPPQQPQGNQSQTGNWSSMLQGGMLGGLAAMIASRIFGQAPLPSRYSWGKELGGEAGQVIGDDVGHFARRGKHAMSSLMRMDLMTYGREASAVVKELPLALKRWGEALKTSQEHLRAFNGVIAGTFLESERRDILRNIAAGSRTGASTAYLAQSLSDIKDTIQPYKDIMTNGFNLLAGSLLRLVNLAAETAEWIVSIKGPLDRIFAWALKDVIKPGEEKLTPGLQFMKWARDWTPERDREADTRRPRI